MSVKKRKNTNTCLTVQKEEYFCIVKFMNLLLQAEIIRLSVKICFAHREVNIKEENCLLPLIFK